MKNEHLREWESVPFSGKPMSEPFRRFCEENVFPKVTITGYNQNKKQEVLTQQVLELVHADRSLRPGKRRGLGAGR